MLGRCWVIDVDMMDDGEGLQAVSRYCYDWGQARSSSRSPARAGDDGLDVEEAGLQRRAVVGETIRLSSGGDSGSKGAKRRRAHDGVDLEQAIRRESARVVRVAGSTQGRWVFASEGTFRWKGSSRAGERPSNVDSKMERERGKDVCEGVIARCYRQSKGW